MCRLTTLEVGYSDSVHHVTEYTPSFAKWSCFTQVTVHSKLMGFSYTAHRNQLVLLAYTLCTHIAMIFVIILSIYSEVASLKLFNKVNHVLEWSETINYFIGLILQWRETLLYRIRGKLTGREDFRTSLNRTNKGSIFFWGSLTSESSMWLLKWLRMHTCMEDRVQLTLLR